MTKFTAKAGDLLRAVGAVAPIIERRNTIPILSCLLVRAEGETVRIKATDQDTELTAALSADVHAPGGVCVAAAPFWRLLRTQEDDTPITISAHAENRITIEAGETTVILRGQPEEDFPHSDLGALIGGFRLTAEDLTALIGRVAFAISTNEARYYLNGVHIRAKDGRLLAEATDGHRLAQSTIPLPVPDAGTLPSVILARRFVQWLLSEAGKADAASDVTVNAYGKGRAWTTVEISFGTLTAVSKTIDATFPDTDRVVPERNGPPATLDRRRLIRALDIVGSVREEKAGAVAFGFNGARLSLTLDQSGGGTAKTAIPSGYAGAETTIGFQWRYMRELARVFRGDLLRVHLTDAANPAIFDTPDDPSFQVLQMPMRL